jgi:chorismate mutase
MASQPNDQQTDAVLASFRKSIDNIDAALIHILAERFRITKEVGAYKARTGMAPADPGREEQQIKRLRSRGSRPRSRVQREVHPLRDR